MSETSAANWVTSKLQLIVDGIGYVVKHEMRYKLDCSMEDDDDLASQVEC